MLINVERTCQLATWCKGDKIKYRKQHRSLLRGHYAKRIGCPYESRSHDPILLLGSHRLMLVFLTRLQFAGVCRVRAISSCDEARVSAETDLTGSGSLNSSFSRRSFLNLTVKKNMKFGPLLLKLS